MRFSGTTGYRPEIEDAERATPDARSTTRRTRPTDRITDRDSNGRIRHDAIRGDPSDHAARRRAAGKTWRASAMHRTNRRTECRRQVQIATTSHPRGQNQHHVRTPSFASLKATFLRPSAMYAAQLHSCPSRNLRVTLRWIEAYRAVKEVARTLRALGDQARERAGITEGGPWQVVSSGVPGYDRGIRREN